mgnify:CR=1 FL=1
MIKEKNPLTEEMYSRIINTLLDSFNGSKEMIKDSRQVALILELSASSGQMRLVIPGKMVGINV